VDKLTLGALGLAGEAGRWWTPSRSGPILRHLLDQEARLVELGDVLWYLALIGSIFDWSLEEMVAANVAKLRKRYPEGFEAARSVHRDARAMIVRGTVLGRSHRGGTPPMLPPLGPLRACIVLFLGMVGGGRVRRLPWLSPVGGQRVAGGSRDAREQHSFAESKRVVRMVALWSVLDGV